MTDIQSSAKRVRFSECATTPPPAAPAACSANDAFELDFELVGGTRWRAHPTYTHQFFDEEEVHGYAGLRATLKLSRELTHSLLEVSWNARLEAADDVPRSVAEGFQPAISEERCSTDLNGMSWALKHLDGVEQQHLGHWFWEFRALQRLCDRAPHRGGR